MTLQEIKEKLKVNYYGEMTFCNKLNYRITCTGTIIFISKKGTVTFYDNEKNEYYLKPEEVISFKEKEMLPPPTEYANKPIAYEGGKWIFVDSGKEAKIDR